MDKGTTVVSLADTMGEKERNSDIPAVRKHAQSFPRVLILLATNQRRGAETQGRQLGRQLQDRGWTADVMALSSTSKQNTLDVPVVADRPLSIKTLWRLRQLGRRYDVVVAFGSKAVPACALAFMGSKTPFIYRSIGDPTAWIRSPWHRIRTGFISRRASKVVPLWTSAAGIFTHILKVDHEQITVIPNARNEVQFKPPTLEKRELARQRYGYLAGDTVVLSIGSLATEKNVSLAIQAIAYSEHLHLLVLGDGPLREQLESLTRQLNCPRVQFAGALTDVLPAYHAADLLLLTSSTEGMPGTIIEAGLCGVPFVATDVGAISDMVNNGLEGRMVDKAIEPAELIRVIDNYLHELSKDPSSVSDRCKSLYTWTKVTDEWELLLTSFGLSLDPMAENA